MNNSGQMLKRREYLTNLSKRRSIIALISAALTIVVAFYGLVGGIDMTFTNLGKNAFYSFIYFTMVSDTLALLSASFVFPYCIEGIRNNHFVLPRWIIRMHYAATVCIATVMMFVFCFMSWADPQSAFGGTNIFTHVFCPILILISFFQIENRYKFMLKDQLIAMVPYCIYISVYFIEVVIIGEENGGWPDIYQIMTFLPAWIAIPFLLLFGFGVSFVIRLISNYLTKIRNRRMFAEFKKDVDQVEAAIQARVEAYGLGTMAAQTADKNRIIIPYEILEELAEAYDLDFDRVMKPFMSGIIKGMK
jgi:hypothetical protein